MDLATSDEPSFLIWKSSAEPEVHEWPLMRSTLEAFGVLFGYVFLVIFLLPFYMKRRKAFELNNILFAYNSVHVVLSAFLVYKTLVAGGIQFTDLISPVCNHRANGSTEHRLNVAKAIWWYVLAKFLELPDTIFFILRKKYNQASFLHIYHHATTFLYAWLVLKISPEENAVLVVLLNSSIHILMYTYYAVSAMGPKYQKYLWWKKYMTTLQIIQFIIMISLLTLGKFSNCNYSNFIHSLLTLNTAFMIYLFSGFYSSTYKKRNETPKSD